MGRSYSLIAAMDRSYYPGLDVLAQIAERDRAVLKHTIMKLTDIEIITQRFFGLSA
jgi:hypothetical protein